MTSVLGVPAAAVAVVALPLVVLAAQREGQASGPETKKAALTVRLEGSSGSAKDPALVRLAAAGAPPKAGMNFKLANDTGLLTAEVSPAAKSECAKAALRTTGLEAEVGATQWCLRLTEVDTGAELKGTISGAGSPSTDLTLTVTRRNGFWWGPFGFIAAGLLVGVLVILVPRGAKRLVQRVVLSRLVADNDSRIEGLAKFAKDRLDSGQSTAATAALLAPIVEQGPVEAAKARERLRHAVAKSGLDASSAFAKAATEEANRRIDRLDDFLDPATGAAHAHPADEWSSAVQRMVDATTFCDEAARRIDALEQKCQAEPDRKLREARETMRNIVDRDEIDRLDPRLDALRKAIENAEANPDCRLSTLGASDAPLAALALPERAAPGPLVTDRARLRGLTVGAVLLCVLLGAVIASFAVATIAVSVYEPNETFSGWTDYFLLFATAVGSGAAASILGIVGWWHATAAPEAT